MGVTLEPVTGFLLRAGTNHNRYGDPYPFACHVDVKDGVATLKAGRGELYPKFYTEMFRTVIKMDFREVHWQRIKDGKVKWVVWKNKKFKAVIGKIGDNK